MRDILEAIKEKIAELNGERITRMTPSRSKRTGKRYLVWPDEYGGYELTYIASAAEEEDEYR